MHKADNVLPILITECGSLQNGRLPSDNWLRLVAWNGYLVKSMQRPDQIDLFVPFIFTHASWNPYSGDNAFTPKTDRKRHVSVDDFDRTTIANYFDFWSDFDGRRLPVSFDRDYLDVVAVHNDQRISLAVTNMGGRQIALDLVAVAKQTGSTGASQTRLNYHKGDVVYQPNQTVDPAAVPVDVNETTIVHLEIAKPLNPQKVLQLQRAYATATAVKVTEKQRGQPLDYQIDDVASGSIKSAKLIIGIHRSGGLTKPLEVEFNGETIDVDTGDSNEFSEFFAPLDAIVPARVIKPNNRITIKAQPNTTVTSVQLVTHTAVN
jgi:agarase